MSGIKFASENENLSLGSRSRPKKRRSSILKSPSRNALNDLDQNAEEKETTSFAKKKRRSSRRVSFAHTYQVQEYLTTNQLKILEETTAEAAQNRSTPPDLGKDAQQTAPSNTFGGSSDQGTSRGPALQPDVSVGPGHCIRGLETLLSGPIKNPSSSHQEAIGSEHGEPIITETPDAAATSLPAMAATAERPTGGPGSRDLPPPSVAGQRAWPELADDRENPTVVGLVGPSYHCALPMAESFSSSGQGSFSCGSAGLINDDDLASPESRGMSLDDTASLERTLCWQQYLATGMVSEPLEIKAVASKQDSSSFLKSFMDDNQPSQSVLQPRTIAYDVESRPATLDSREFPKSLAKKQEASSFLKSFLDDDRGKENCQQPPQSAVQPRTLAYDVEDRQTKMDSRDFLRSLASPDGPRASVPTPRVSSTAPPNKRDAKSFLQTLSGSESPQPSIAAAAADETRLFPQSGTAADMDLTACVGVRETAVEGGRPRLDGGYFLRSVGEMAYPGRLSEHQRAPPAARGVPVDCQDVTIRFVGDQTGSMELTQCLGGVQDRAVPVRPSAGEKRSRAGQPLGDITQIFDGVQMDLTVCAHPPESAHSPSATAGGMGRASHTAETRPAERELSDGPYPKQTSDRTTIFHQDDFDANMEMTACLTSQDPAVQQSNSSNDCVSFTQADQTDEKTKVFHREDTNAAMDLTTCLDGKPASHLAAGLPWGQEAEQTRIFHRDEATSAMEMTSCLGSLRPKSDSLDSSKPAAVAEVTRIFRHGDAAAAMDETDCLDEKLPGTGREPRGARGAMRLVGKIHSSEASGSDDRQGAEKTQIFPAGDAQGMELTACIGGVISAPHSSPAGKPSAESAAEPPRRSLAGKLPKTAPDVPAGESSARSRPGGRRGADVTRTFSCADDTAGMEMTACVGGLLTTADLGRSPAQQEDRMRIFGRDDTARMELTACLSSLKPLPSVVEVCDSRHPASHDETAKMEMTTCMGGILPRMLIDATSEDEASKQPGDGEHTRIFSADDTARMDMTRCVGSLCSEPLAAKPQPDEVGDRTEVFGPEDTARMELTTCLGGLLPTTARREMKRASTSPPGETGSPPGTCLRGDDPRDQTRIFHAAMEMTACVGAVLRESVSTSPGPEGALGERTALVEHTRHFFAGGGGGDDGRMEMTTCIGGIAGGDPRQSSPQASASPPPPDSTRFFSPEEKTGLMELTQCVGARELSPARRPPHSPALSPPTAGSVGPSSQAAGRQMELSDATECPDGSGRDRVRLGVKSEAVPSDPGLSVKSTGNGALPEPPSSQSGAISCPIATETGDSQDATGPDPQTQKSPHQRSSDTFTIQSSAGGTAEVVPRHSDTFTLDRPSAASPRLPTPAAAAAVDGPTDGLPDGADCRPVEASVGSVAEAPSVLGDLNRWGSLDSADGIESEEPVWLENTEDFTELSAVMEAIGDKSDLESIPEFPAPSGDSSPEEPTAPQSQDGDSAKQPNEAVPSPLPVSMQDFLAHVTISMRKGRRSVQPPIPKAVAPKSLGDLLEDHFILGPKKELYEWAISHLSSSVERMQDALSEQEQRLSANNPEIVKEVQLASPKKAAELNERIAQLHKACSKMSQSSFQDWQLKMLKKTQKSFTQTEEEMREVAANLSASLDTLNESLEELGRVKADLDESLARLRRCKPPGEEEVRLLLLRQTELKEKQAEVEAVKADMAACEGECIHLKSDIKSYEEEMEHLRDQELLLSNQASPQCNLEEALVKLEDLHCLQEWRLRRNTKDELVFTFLGDTLVLTLQLGQEIDSGGGSAFCHRAITDVHLEPNLSADADVCAQLAHRLILASVDTSTLLSRHTSTAGLKGLLQEVSQVVRRADGIADEMDKIKYRHAVTLDGINPVVEFSSLDAFVMFWVTFHLHTGGYPFKIIRADVKHKIGNLGDEDIQSALSQVKPGWRYVSRLVAAIDALIREHVPSEL